MKCTNTCQKPSDVPSKCSICSGEHTASYRGCPKRPVCPTSSRQTQVMVPPLPVTFSRHSGCMFLKGQMLRTAGINFQSVVLPGTNRVSGVLSLAFRMTTSLSSARTQDDIKSVVLECTQEICILFNVNQEDGSRSRSLQDGTGGCSQRCNRNRLPTLTHLRHNSPR